MSKENPFSATAPALGYLYQVRLALLWALRRLKTGTGFKISVETLDDVTFHDEQGKADNLIQTKHHLNKVANLTNASPDLWKSLRGWIENSRAGRIPEEAILWLLTTALAGADSIASLLRDDENRDIDKAISELLATAQTSTSVENAPAYKVFLETAVTERKLILSRVFILDNSPTITDLSEGIKTEVFWAAPRSHQSAFLERLEGWWLGRVVRQLTIGSAGSLIDAEELESQMGDLRDQFQHDSLPVDEDLLSFVLNEEIESTHLSSNFVRQIELAKASKGRILAAIRDYYRAFEQRSRWARDELLFGYDLERYERRLIEEWELVFLAMKDELGESAAEDAKLKAARKILQWAESCPLQIRPRVSEPFVTRGSLHMLADQLKLGWHPEFQERLARLLGGAALSL